MAKITLSSKNQVTLPVDMVRSLGLKPGDKLAAELIDGRIVLLPQPENWTDYFGGIAKGVYGSTDEEIDKYIEGERFSAERLAWKQEFEDLANGDIAVHKLVKTFRESPYGICSLEELMELTPFDVDAVSEALEKLMNHGSIRRSFVDRSGGEAQGKLYRLVRDFMKPSRSS